MNIPPTKSIIHHFQFSSQHIKRLGIPHRDIHPIYCLIQLFSPMLQKHSLQAIDKSIPQSNMHFYVKSLQKFGVQLIYFLSRPSSIENIVALQTVVKIQKWIILNRIWVLYIFAKFGTHHKHIKIFADNIPRPRTMWKRV